MWAWGRRSNGEIGDGARGGVSAIGPTRVPGLEGIKQIAADGSHTLALRSDGHVMAWGLNHSGELGTGTRDNASTPVEVKGLDRVVAIAAGTAKHNAPAAKAACINLFMNSLPFCLGPGLTAGLTLSGPLSLPRIQACAIISA